MLQTDNVPSPAEAKRTVTEDDRIDTITDSLDARGNECKSYTL